MVNIFQNDYQESTIIEGLYVDRNLKWLSSFSLCLTFETDPNRGCWDIQLLMFWVVCTLISIRLRNEEDLASGCWDIFHSKFSGKLSFEVVFHWRLSSRSSSLTWVLVTPILSLLQLARLEKVNEWARALKQFL